MKWKKVVYMITVGFSGLVFSYEMLQILWSLSDFYTLNELTQSIIYYIVTTLFYVAAAIASYFLKSSKLFTIICTSLIASVIITESLLYLFNIHYRSLTEGQTEHFVFPLWASCLLEVFFWCVGIAVQIFFTRKHLKEENDKEKGSIRMLRESLKTDVGESTTVVQSNVERTHNVGDVHFDARD